MEKLRISSTISLHHYPKDNVVLHVQQGLAFLKKIGFDAADIPLWLFDVLGDGWPGWEACVEKILQDSEDLGIRFEVCHLPMGVKAGGTFEEFTASIHRGIDAAKVLGVDYAVVHPHTSVEPLETFDHQARYDMVMAHLAPFAEHAAKVGVNIVVENMPAYPQTYPIHRYCQSAEEVCEIADALGIGVCWDFGHANISGIEKQSEALAYVGSRLKVLHVNDNFAYQDNHIAPFGGSIDWADAMEGLTAVGFQGLLNYEVLPYSYPAGVRESYARYLLDTAKELLKLLR